MAAAAAVVVLVAVIVFVLVRQASPDTVTCSRIGQMSTTEAEDVLAQLLDSHDKDDGSYNIGLATEEVWGHCGIARWGGGSSRNFNDVVDEFVQWD